MYSLQKTQLLNASRDKVWDFMSSPLNLEIITPPNMNFEIINDFDTQKMYPGQIIEYHITPFFGLKMNWVTEITHVKEHEFFVDEQRFGPYMQKKPYAVKL